MKKLKNKNKFIRSLKEMEAALNKSSYEKFSKDEFDKFLKSFPEDNKQYPLFYSLGIAFKNRLPHQGEWFATIDDDLLDKYSELDYKDERHSNEPFIFDILNTLMSWGSFCGENLIDNEIELQIRSGALKIALMTEQLRRKGMIETKFISWDFNEEFETTRGPNFEEFEENTK